MRRRKKTQFVESSASLDFTVLSFKCTDAAVHKALGMNTKEIEWKVQCRNAPPLTIKVHYDKSVMGGTECWITCDAQKIFPVDGREKTRIVDDFTQTWPFRGMAKGINEKGFVAMRLMHQGEETWFPATVRKQCPDGQFEVMVTKPGYAMQQADELYPFVNKSDLRVASNKNPYTAPERFLNLTVPVADPLEGTALTDDAGDDITQYFGRQTPHAKGANLMPKIVLTVMKDRSLVTGNFGHQQLMPYWNGEARAIEATPKLPGKLVGFGSKLWKIEVGLCEHVIEVERKSKVGKDITVTVDGDVLIQALAEDIDWQEEGWGATFRFAGEPLIEFDVHESDTYGIATDSMGRVRQNKSYSRRCLLKVPDVSNLSTATLHIDGMDFKDLQIQVEGGQQGQFSMSPSAMLSQYHITVPFKVNREAAQHARALVNWGYTNAPTKDQMFAAAGAGKDAAVGAAGAAGGVLGWSCFPSDRCCCSQGSAETLTVGAPPYGNAGYHTVNAPNYDEGVPGYDNHASPR